MALGFALVVIAVGAALLYKGYKNYSWNELYRQVFGQGKVPVK
ncbi:MAG TPA: hypothetical protein VMW35_09565 [Myxococcota bacterium]|nr:hypothetical protein [Myxococcota bacterium]